MKTCIDCGTAENTTRVNDRCVPCYEIAAEVWQKRYNTRQDASGLDAQKLVNYLLTQLWQHECQIIPDFMPNFPREDTKPTCVIRHVTGESHEFLRYSNGPLQGFFWDIYGDDFHSPELALVALSQCPPPRGAMCVATHGN